MKRTLLLSLLLVFSISASAQKNCQVKPHPEYDKKIAEYTTEKFFSTELVDHLPMSTCVPSPDQHLKHIVGEPNTLTYTKDVHAYMRLLDEKSARVKVEVIGKSEEGRDMLLVFISDEANLAKLDRYKEITAKLADPRGLPEAEAQKLIAEGKPMYWASGAIHSPETASPELMMELAYRLAVEESPFIQKIRKDSIVMLTPVVEVDGRDRMVDIYLDKKRNPDQPQKPLNWWGHYVAHDNNRDGMTLSLALSRHMMNTFLKYHPQVFHDLHESVPYLYISTGTGPYNAWLDPITITEWQQMAYHEINEMTRRGVIGVWTHGFYDGWAPNYMFYLANGHNAVGRFYETFGNGGADTRMRTLGPTSTSREWYRPNPPLPKVKWSLRNNVNMAQSALLFGIHNVASNGQKFLENFYAKSKRSVAKARMEGPAAWVLPADDPRPAEQARLLNLLKAQGVEVHKTSAEIRIPAKAEATATARAEASGGAARSDGAAASTGSKPDEAAKKEPPKDTIIPAGSYIVRMDQPYSRMADMMMDTQYYSPRDPRSYDDTGWTIGALRNVKTTRVMDTKILDGAMAKVDGEIKPVVADQGGLNINGSMKGMTLVINHNTDNPIATFRFKFPDATILAAQEPFEMDGRKFKVGSLLVQDATLQMQWTARELGISSFFAVGTVPKIKSHKLATPRIALLQLWGATQNDGWYRLAMDKLEVPYTYLPETVIREMKPGELRSKFDALIIPPVTNNLGRLLRGITMRENQKPMSWKNTPETPNLVAPGLNEADDIRGGLGYSGLTNLREFVQSGGLIVATGQAAQIPIDAGMTEMVTVTEPRNLQAPGSVVLANVEDKKSPIAYGYDDKLYVYFRQAPVLSISTGFAQQNVAGGTDATRSSGRGNATEPDVIQTRQYTEPERPQRRSPREQELYVAEDLQELALTALPPKSHWPRVILRFAPEKDLLLSGMMVGANELAEKPAVVDIPSGKGHVVLFANNPMWRDETMGSFFLLFNALMNYDNLNVGR